jgi:hypothetical protein
MFMGPTVIRNPLHLLESTIKDANQKYWSSDFLSTRDDYLEDTTHELLKKALPSCHSFRGVYYYYEENGERRRAEVDSVFLCDDALLIVESKAGAFSDPARRGGLLRVRSEVEELVDEAYRQGTRLLSLIESSPGVALVDDSGRELIHLLRDLFRFAFIVNVTFESLPGIQENLRTIRNLGFLHGRLWPWSVCLSDLRVVLEILEHPSMLIHYLMRRHDANDFEPLDIVDELDLFSYYLDGQLFFDRHTKRRMTRLTLTGYTGKLDRYYDFLAGLRSDPVEKPRQKMPLGFEAIVTELESRRPQHWLSACLALLDCDGPTRQKAADTIPILEQKYAARHRPQAGVMYCEQGRRLLVLAVAPESFVPQSAGFSEWNRVAVEKRPKRTLVLWWTPPLNRGLISVRLQ